MNSSDNEPEQTARPKQPGRGWAVTIGAVLVAWLGIHFNAALQAIRAANTLQLQNPTGTHSRTETNR